MANLNWKDLHHVCERGWCIPAGCKCPCHQSNITSIPAHANLEDTPLVQGLVANQNNLLTPTRFGREVEVTLTDGKPDYDANTLYFYVRQPKQKPVYMMVEGSLEDFERLQYALDLLVDGMRQNEEERINRLDARLDARLDEAGPDPDALLDEEFDRKCEELQRKAKGA